MEEDAPSISPAAESGAGGPGAPGADGLAQATEKLSLDQPAASAAPAAVAEPPDAPPVDESKLMEAYRQLTEADPRDHLNVVFIGHVDAGKSTLGGQILFLTGGVDKRTIEKYEREAKDKNRESWYMAYIMDTNEEERTKGITVEVRAGHPRRPPPLAAHVGGRPPARVARLVACAWSCGGDGLHGGAGSCMHVCSSVVVAAAAR
jgi:peptide chain release factor subunit 3